MSETELKKCLLLSYGPVPVPEQSKVEGGGLRIWGLAQGLQSQNEKLDITVAYSQEYEKDNATSEFSDITIKTWTIDSIKNLLTDYDTVIVSYCMGKLSEEVVKHIKPNQQLVLDCYVPIYVEISARESSDLENEYHAFLREVDNWSKILKRGDLFLCANNNQKRFYQGVLSAVGRVNPATYGDEQILTVPYGVYRDIPKPKEKPIEKMLATHVASFPKRNKKYKKLLWFGGIYPWFDIKTLIDAVEIVNEKHPVKLVIVGAKNPFNAHPDFTKSYENLVSYIEANPVHRENILMQDWVEFSERADWYLDSDMVILINKTGEENELAWRTRLVDYIWADLPIITNGGDPLGEELIENGAAIKLHDLSMDGLAAGISNAFENANKIKEVKQNISTVRQNYYWDVVVKRLANHIHAHTRPSDTLKFGLMDVFGVAEDGSLPRRIIKKAKKLPKYYKNNGPRATLFTIKTMVGKRVIRLLPAREKRVIFIAHQLDTTGAPHVFIDSVKHFLSRYPKVPIEFHTFHPADKVNIRELNGLGIKPKMYLNKDISLIFSKGDTLVLNTVAFSETFKNSVFESLERNVAKKLVWYIHEDEPEIIFDDVESRRIKKLLNDDKIIIYTAAVKTRKNYMKHFGNENNIRLQMYHIEMEPKRHKVRSSSDFNDLRFILPGMMGDTRKGQLPVAYAFAEFKRRFYDKNPDRYRDFSLTYIGVGKDFPSRQLLKHTDKGLGRHFTALGPMSHEKCLDEVMKANVTICYSLRECLPMYVYEGMVAGHPILRNDSSGMEEQLQDGINGLYIDSTDIEQVINQIEKILNKKKMTSAQLASMSKSSHDITLPLEKIRYEELIDAVYDTYTHEG